MCMTFSWSQACSNAEPQLFTSVNMSSFIPGLFFFLNEWHKNSTVSAVLFLCKRDGLGQGSVSSVQDASADIRNLLIKSVLIRRPLMKAFVSFLPCCPSLCTTSDSSVSRESTCNAGDTHCIPGSGRSPGEGNGSPLQDSGLENSKDCIVQGVAKSQTPLSNFHFHFTVLLRFLEIGKLGVRRPAGILSSVRILFCIKASSLPSRLRDLSRQSTTLLSLAFLPQIPIYPSTAHTPPLLPAILIIQFNSVQSFSRVRLFATPWTAACQASLSITNSQSLLKLMSIESVMPSNHLILCHPLLLLLSIFPSIRVFPNESTLRIRWPKY